ncbi:all-trans-retinol 13,14-reductase-like [Diadema antillarum]|uniref:all-trans-retinol 13,14-reductase-like n=1 Tax=Diadema antillarum TaxID=105358 RepID=UPI003A87B534
MAIASQIVAWAFANPVLTALCIFLVFLVVFAVQIAIKLKPGPNPFAQDCARPPAPVVSDSSARDKVIKQGFTPQKVPTDLDAIVVGSGIGGLSVAGILAKAGKKVLVLEQHDQAGGCCHTFVEKGYEFDVGIHYIGEMATNTITRTYIDQLTEGQLLWEPIDKNYDTIVVGEGEKKKFFKMEAGSKTLFRDCLVGHFPEEEQAIDKYLFHMREQRVHMQTAFLLKMLPMSVCQLLISTGMINAMTKYFKYSAISLQRFLDSITENPDLKAVLSYCFGDYGTIPEDTSLMMHMLLMNHYMYGGFYPRGGASEIAYHIIPVIEKAGGRVLVRAPVSQILIDSDGAACGVRVTKATGDVDIHAPLIISDAGLVNTYQKLLPIETVKKHDLMDKFKGTRTALAGFSLFVGLKGTAEELELPKRQYWVFTNNDLNGITKTYASLSAAEAMTAKIPLLFISFPSAKDSTWEERYPGKSVCTLVTLANWEWFQEWETRRINHRGDAYEAVKKGISDRMWERVLELFPKLEGKVDYFEAGSPLTNKFYLAQNSGEMYGLDHNTERFSAETWTNLRPDTPVPNLYLTGQDILTCGFAGAMYAGLLCSSKILNRNLIGDLSSLKAKKNKAK